MPVLILKIFQKITSNRNQLGLNPVSPHIDIQILQTDRSPYISLEGLREVAGDHFIDFQNLFSIIYWYC